MVGFYHLVQKSEFRQVFGLFGYVQVVVMLKPNSMWMNPRQMGKTKSVGHIWVILMLYFMYRILEYSSKCSLWFDNPHVVTAVYSGLDFCLVSDIEFVNGFKWGDSVHCIWVCGLSYHEAVVHLLWL